MAMHGNRRSDDISLQPDPGTEDPFSVAMTVQDSASLDMVRGAIRRQDVVMAFQPVVSPAVPETPAFHEGFIRVYDDTGRVIPAAAFIGAVETLEIGRILDCLSLEMGLATLSSERSLRLAVNMSARSIAYPRWTRALDAALSDDPSLGERLILEITEPSAMLMPDIVTGFMRNLQRKGVAFALDDFGAGYTSFRHLRQFFFDIVKIDGQFIRGISANPDNQVLCQALISVARHFDMLTVAESVEAAPDAEFLESVGIDCMQGYYFGAPTIVPPWRMTEHRKTA